MNKELVEKVKSSFELNIYETKVWLALLSKGDSNIATIHELSKVPRSRIYDVLKSLENKGFCVEKLGKPIKYLAVEPSLVIEKLKNKIKSDSDEKIVMINKVIGTDEYTQLQNLYDTTFDISDRMGTSIKGRNNLVNHLLNASKKATDRVVLVSTPKLLEKKMKLLFSILNNKAKKGINVTIGVASSTGENLSDELLNKLSKSNLKVKKFEKDARFCVVDNGVLLVNTPESAKDDTALWLESDFFASTLDSLLKKK